MIRPAIPTAVAAILFASSASPVDDVRPQQRPGGFTSGVTAVPIDVRVLDSSGNPLLDLEASQFTVWEDGTKQEIVHFSRSAPADMNNPASIPRGSKDKSTTSARIFVIVLGRGRLDHPARGVEAAVEFVRNGLSPADQVALVAYKRATSLTTDRAAIANLLERFQDRHENIEAALRHWFSGLQFAFGSPDLPPHIVAMIEAIFQAPGVPPTRELVLRTTKGLGEFERLRQEAIDLLAGSESDDSAAVRQTAARQEAEQLYATIEWLRGLPGEKHLIFLTAEAFHGFGRKVTDLLVSMASDARVTLSTIQTGGLPLEWTRPDPRIRGLVMPRLRSRTALQALGLRDARQAAEMTGGVYSGYRWAAAAFEDIERSTRHSYLLGYYSTNQRLDGSYREVRVEVNRKDVMVLSRRGYFAQPVSR